MWKIFEDRLMDLKMVKTMAMAVAITFLIIHICFFQLFFYYGVKPMAYFNIFSMIFYVCMLLLVRKEMLRAYAIGTYLEVVVHMCLAAYFTGWENGFQITLIGMCILAFFASYVSKYLKMAALHSMRLAAVGMVGYLLTCVICHVTPTPYQLLPKISFYLQLLLGIVVFVVMMIFLDLFLKLSTRYEDVLATRADYDQLTGLPNRYYLWERLSELDRDPGLDGHWIALIDIDGFKNINDTYGHNTGDIVLRDLALLMKDNMPGVIVSRWGGEEFLLLGNEKQGRGAASEILEKMRQAVMEYEFKCEHNNTLHLTVTAGVSAYRDSLSLHDWIGDADEKLYRGKKSGKNRIET